jgi:hypothetical protein
MREQTAVIILFLFFIVVASLGFQPLPAPYGDNARYIILAKSLIQGKGLKLINHPDEPAEKKILPLYPAILAFLIFVFGYNIVILKVSSLAFMGLALFFFYLFLRKVKLPPAIRLGVLFLVCTSPYSWEYCRDVLSEAPFIFLIAITAFFLAVYEEEKPKNFLYAAIFSSVCAALVRDVGILMLAAIAVILLKQKEYRRFAMVIAVCIFLSGAWLYKNLHSQDGYLTEFVGRGNYLMPSNQLLGGFEFLRRYVYESCAYLGDILPDFILPVFKNIVPHSKFWWFKIAFGIFCSGVIIKGWINFRKKQKSLFFLIFSLLYGFCLPLFGSYGIRYIVPIGFFLFLGLSYGLAQTRFFRNRQVLVSFLVFVLLSNALLEIKQITYLRQGYPGEWANYYQALFYLKDNSDKEKVVICRKPFLGYLLSGHKTLGYPYVSDAQELFSYIQNSGVGYVIIDDLKIANIPFSRKYLWPAVSEHLASFSLVYQTGEPLTQVYKIK